MTKTRQEFAPEFKCEAVALLEGSRRPLTPVAAELGVQPSMLRAWQAAIHGAVMPSWAAPPRSDVVGAMAAPPASLAYQIAKLKRELGPDAEGARRLKKSRRHLRGGAEMRFAFIEQHACTYPVRLMCRVLEVSPSGYYAWRLRPESLRVVCQPTASPRFATAPGPPSRPLRQPQNARGASSRGPRLQPRQDRAADATARHSGPVAPNLLGQQFLSPAPSRIWLADITYIPTGEGWLYLAAILDLAMRRIVGWAMREHMRTELTLAGLMMAAQRQRPAPGLIHHSDRGSQYATGAYVEQLAAIGASAAFAERVCWMRSS